MREQLPCWLGLTPRTEVAHDRNQQRRAQHSTAWLKGEGGMARSRTLSVSSAPRFAFVSFLVARFRIPTPGSAIVREASAVGDASVISMAGLLADRIGRLGATGLPLLVRDTSEPCADAWCESCLRPPDGLLFVEFDPFPDDEYCESVDFLTHFVLSVPSWTGCPVAAFPPTDCVRECPFAGVNNFVVAFLSMRAACPCDADRS
jgi:hypothetical protein